MGELTTRERVYAEQVFQLYRLSRPAYVGTLITSSILVFALWGVVSSAMLGAWLCGMFALTGGRFLLYRAYVGLSPAVSEARDWAKRFVIGAGATGLLWGVAGSVLYPVASVHHQFLLIFLIGGMSLSSTVILAPVQQAFLAYMLPAMSLVTATVFVQGTPLHLFMGALMLVFLGVMLAITPVIAEMMRDSLRAKFDNSVLVAQLSQANRELSEHIAAQQRSEEELRQSEQRYRYMFEANPLPMWIRDGETLRILGANAAALRTYGYTREEFLRLQPGGLHARADFDRFQEMMRTRDPDRGYRTYWRHRRKDGSVMDVETISHPFELDDGRRARLVLVHDITERKHAEQRLQMGHT